MIKKFDGVYVLKIKESAVVDNWDLLLAEYESNDKCEEFKTDDIKIIHGNG